MRIAIDGTPAINDQRAIRRYCRRLLMELARLDADADFSVLYLGCRAGVARPRLDNPRFREIASAVPGRVLKWSWALCHRPDIAFWLGDDPDLLHFPGGATYIPARCRTVLVTMHGFAAHAIPGLMARSFREAVVAGLERTIARATDFITVSEANRREMMERWGIAGERITAIPLGIGEEFREIALAPDERTALIRRHGLPERPFILFVGALEPHKNIAGIIAAYAALDQGLRRDLDLVLVGAETSCCREFREQAARLGVAGQVRFTGFIAPEDPDLPSIYNLARAFVFPTFYEGWASPPLEAMRCGVPAVVADIPSLRESTGGVARYCDPHQPEDIAAQLTALLATPGEHAARRQQGMAFAESCTWRQCAERTMALYRRLAACRWRQSAIPQVRNT